MNKISQFTDNNLFLSNFFPVTIISEGIEYPSVEHAYQAAKSPSRENKIFISRCGSPGNAKRLGRRLVIRDDWERVKDKVMYDLLLLKFQEPFLLKKLLNTGDAELEEGNTWGDIYWGTVNGYGKNTLGKLLMDVREHYRNHLKVES